MHVYGHPKNCCNHFNIWTMWLYHRVMSPNDTDGMANSVDPDQTAPLGAVWSGSILFAQAYLSENLGSLRYRVRCLADKITCHIWNIMIWKLIPKRHQEVWLKIAAKENYAKILLWRMYRYKPDFPFLWLLSKWKRVKERHIMGQAPSLL